MQRCHGVAVDNCPYSLRAAVDHEMRNVDALRRQFAGTMQGRAMRLIHINALVGKMRS